MAEFTKRSFIGIHGARHLALEQDNPDKDTRGILERRSINSERQASEKEVKEKAMEIQCLEEAKRMKVKQQTRLPLCVLGGIMLLQSFE
ncbi:hypothetical protein CRENBAI_012959 [Crenichthys baileyi]|uniref:Uncharacterized protein n=1 Tax=Crenichthys baileyi TaxID=28760 RepID=A0AAV9RM37_9TELE